MKLPSSFHLTGVRVDVLRVDSQRQMPIRTENTDVYALASPPGRAIYLRRDLGSDEAPTFVHELLHALHWQLSQHNSTDEENCVRPFSLMLLRFLRDNAPLVRTCLAQGDTDEPLVADLGGAANVLGIDVAILPYETHPRHVDAVCSARFENAPPRAYYFPGAARRGDGLNVFIGILAFVLMEYCTVEVSSAEAFSLGTALFAALSDPRNMELVDYLLGDRG